MHESELVVRLLSRWKINFWQGGVAVLLCGLFYLQEMPELGDWPTLVIITLFLAAVFRFFYPPTG